MSASKSCPACQKQWAGTFKFCPEDGALLVLLNTADTVLQTPAVVVAEALETTAADIFNAQDTVVVRAAPGPKASLKASPEASPEASEDRPRDTDEFAAARTRSGAAPVAQVEAKSEAWRSPVIGAGAAGERQKSNTNPKPRRAAARLLNLEPVDAAAIAPAGAARAVRAPAEASTRAPAEVLGAAKVEPVARAETTSVGRAPAEVPRGEAEAKGKSRLVVTAPQRPKLAVATVVAPVVEPLKAAPPAKKQEPRVGLTKGGAAATTATPKRATFSEAAWFMRTEFEVDPVTGRVTVGPNDYVLDEAAQAGKPRSMSGSRKGEE